MAFASKISSVALMAAALPWDTMFMQAVAPSACAVAALWHGYLPIPLLTTSFHREG